MDNVHLYLLKNQVIIMGMIDLNWIYQYGLKVVEKDVEEPILIVPTEIFEKLKEDVERERKELKE